MYSALTLQMGLPMPVIELPYAEQPRGRPDLRACGRLPEGRGLFPERAWATVWYVHWDSGYQSKETGEWFCSCNFSFVGGGPSWELEEHPRQGDKLNLQRGGVA